jgi:3-hydroxyacyl-[acyl-carrier protein] dehydratase/trans-2-decenoyl-[acyl-carrier protein] isomerase
MKYAEFRAKTQFSKAELLASSWNSLVDDPPEGGVPALPAPPFLMFDRIVEVSHRGSQGRIVAEQDVALDAWYFQCHFRNDPVQPGCLGVDAIWQLIGFYSAIRGARGVGRALGSKEIEFSGQIRPHNKVVTYSIDIRRYSALPGSGAAIAIGKGMVAVDGETIYTIQDAKVGVFTGISYATYPHAGANSSGGQMARPNPPDVEVKI